MQTERRCKRKAVLRLSPTMTDNRRPKSLRNFRADWLKEPKVSMSTAETDGLQEGSGTFGSYGWLPAMTRARLNQPRCKRPHKYGPPLRPTSGTSLQSKV